MADEKIIFSMVGVSKTFTNQKKVLNNIYLSFFYGAKIGIIGLNGSGKSTLMKIIAGIDKNFQGEVVFSPGYTVGYLEQEPKLDDAKTVREVVEEGCASTVALLKEYEEINQKLCEPMDDEEMARLIERQGELYEQIDHVNGWELDSVLERAMDALRCPDPDQSVKVLSGGERRRVALCRLLLQQPDVLLLDEPTNHLDLASITWLEEFLMDYQGTVIIVSHDRHFLNNVCTHIVDIDYNKIKMYVGNYDFWYESSRLMQRMMADQKRKADEKIKELQNFIARFAANKSKSKQATSRRKLIDKLTVEELPASSRKYPYVGFTMDREIGKDVLTVDRVSKTVDGVKVLNDVSFTVAKGDKIAFIGDNEIALTTMLQILAEELEPDSGSIKWGVSTSRSYFPKDNSEYFNGCDLSILQWLSQYSKDITETYLRGFLGRMLFSGDDVYKPVQVLSGGEKVRCMLSRMMLYGSNVLILDQPTNHLDLESITAVNNGLVEFKSNVFFTSHDHEFVQTVANRIIEITPDGIVDRRCTFDEYLEWRAENGKAVRN